MKNKKSLIAIIVMLVAVVLIFVNRSNSKAQEELVRSKQLTAYVNAEEKVYSYVEEGDKFVTFDTQMKRKNGDVFDKNYTGIELSNIIEELGVTIDENTAVVATCRDNYRIELSASDILAEGNVYLVTKENGEDIDEESGVFMLVINNDEFSTRWGKNIVKIEIK